jgi:hypothetical protein
LSYNFDYKIFIDIKLIVSIFEEAIMTNDSTIGIERSNLTQRRDELARSLGREPVRLEQEPGVKTIREDRPQPIVQLSEEVPLEDRRMSRRSFEKATLAGAAGLAMTNSLLSKKAHADEPKTKPDEVARVDGAGKQIKTHRREVDIYATKAWKEFKDSLKPDQKYLVDLMQGEIAEAKEVKFSNSQIAELIKYGLEKTIPENVVFGISLLSASLNEKAAMETKDIEKLFDEASTIGNFDSFKAGDNGREKIFKHMTNFAFNAKDGLMFSKMADLALKIKHREGDETYRKRIIAALYKTESRDAIYKAKPIYLLN